MLAADGGAGLCLAWGWPVDAVIGDMDSLSAADQAELAARGVTFHRAPVEKDETDLELALRMALAYGAEEFFIAGTLGARIDHTLGSLALLALPALAERRACIVDGKQTVWLVRGEFVVAGQPGDTLSLLPFGGDASGVSVDGVRWPLAGAELPLGPSLSISNRMIAARARVQVRHGIVLVVHIAS